LQPTSLDRSVDVTIASNYNRQRERGYNSSRRGYADDRERYGDDDPYNPYNDRGRFDFDDRQVGRDRDRDLDREGDGRTRYDHDRRRGYGDWRDDPADERPGPHGGFRVDEEEAAARAARADMIVVRSNTVVGDRAHPRGMVVSRIVRGDIPVANGVVHLIDKPLMIVAKSLYEYITVRRTTL